VAGYTGVGKTGLAREKRAFTPKDKNELTAVGALPSSVYLPRRVK
jgi:hypothetical protein